MHVCICMLRTPPYPHKSYRVQSILLSLHIRCQHMRKSAPPQSQAPPGPQTGPWAPGSLFLLPSVVLRNVFFFCRCMGGLSILACTRQCQQLPAAAAEIRRPVGWRRATIRCCCCWWWGGGVVGKHGARGPGPTLRVFPGPRAPDTGLEDPA